jgi:hypothetical protein
MNLISVAYISASVHGIINPYYDNVVPSFITDIFRI